MNKQSDQTGTLNDVALSAYPNRKFDATWVLRNNWYSFSAVLTPLPGENRITATAHSVTPEGGRSSLIAKIEKRLAEESATSRQKATKSDQAAPVRRVAVNPVPLIATPASAPVASQLVQTLLAKGVELLTELVGANKRRTVHPKIAALIRSAQGGNMDMVRSAYNDLCRMLPEDIFAQATEALKPIEEALLSSNTHSGRSSPPTLPRLR